MADISKLTDIEIDNSDMSDYPDFVDAYISAAKIDGRDLTGEELEELSTNYQNFVYRKAVELIF